MPTPKRFEKGTDEPGLHIVLKRTPRASLIGPYIQGQKSPDADAAQDRVNAAIHAHEREQAEAWGQPAPSPGQLSPEIQARRAEAGAPSGEPIASHQPIDELRTTFLPVGHGGAAVMEVPGKRVIVYDAGSMNNPDMPRRVLMPFLKRRGIKHIDEVFLSHGDIDHFNAVPRLIAGYGVGQLTVPPQMLDDPKPEVRRLLKIAKDYGVPVRTAQAGQRLSSGPVTFDVLNPTPDLPANPDNPTSMVLRVSYGANSMLLTGDLEGEGLKGVLAQPPQPSDVMMSPHHGSATAHPAALAAWSRDPNKPNTLNLSQDEKTRWHQLEQFWEQRAAASGQLPRRPDAPQYPGGGTLAQVASNPSPLVPDLAESERNANLQLAAEQDKATHEAFLAEQKQARQDAIDDGRYSQWLNGAERHYGTVPLGSQSPAPSRPNYPPWEMSDPSQPIPADLESMGELHGIQNPFSSSDRYLQFLAASNELARGTTDPGILSKLNKLKIRPPLPQLAARRYFREVDKAADAVTAAARKLNRLNQQALTPSGANSAALEEAERAFAQSQLAYKAITSVNRMLRNVPSHVAVGTALYAAERAADQRQQEQAIGQAAQDAYNATGGAEIPQPFVVAQAEPNKTNVDPTVDLSTGDVGQITVRMTPNTTVLETWRAPKAPGPMTDADKFDLNTATREDLRSVPRLGEGTADKILMYRDQHGGIGSLDELANIKGLGPKTRQLIAARAKVDPASAPDRENPGRWYPTPEQAKQLSDAVAKRARESLIQGHGESDEDYQARLNALGKQFVDLMEGRELIDVDDSAYLAGLIDRVNHALPDDVIPDILDIDVPRYSRKLMKWVLRAGKKAVRSLGESVTPLDPTLGPPPLKAPGPQSNAGFNPGYNFWAPSRGRNPTARPLETG